MIQIGLALSELPYVETRFGYFAQDPYGAHWAEESLRQWLEIIDEHREKISVRDRNAFDGVVRPREP